MKYFIAGVFIASLLFGMQSGSRAEGWEPLGLAGTKIAVNHSQWPTTEGELRGFSFQRTDYAALEAFETTEDSTDVRFIEVLNHPLSAHWHSGTDDPYRFFVSRHIVLKHEIDEVKITIRVAPSVAEMHRYVLWSLSGNSLPVYESLQYGPLHSVVIGNVCVLCDRNTDTWQASDCRDLFFIRNNVHVSVTGPQSLNVIALAQAMDAKIEEQRVAAGGNPVRPEVSFSVASELVNPATVRPALATVDVSAAATWNGSAENVTLTTFATKQTPNYRWRAEGPDMEAVGPNDPEFDWEAYMGIEPDPVDPTTYSAASLSFDSDSAPTKIVSLGSHKDGKYHAGIVAWGPNLLPKVAYAPLEVNTDHNE